MAAATSRALDAAFSSEATRLLFLKEKVRNCQNWLEVKEVVEGLVSERFPDGNSLAVWVQSGVTAQAIPDECISWVQSLLKHFKCLKFFLPANLALQIWAGASRNLLIFPVSDSCDNSLTSLHNVHVLL